MKHVSALFLTLISTTAVLSSPASAANICTVVADAQTGRIVAEEGDCRTRVTPASTFKIPLAVMGYDAGYLRDRNLPALEFREGYAAWGGPNWTQTTTPERWMTYSVVWYSQQITHALGVHKLAAYTDGFAYGNSDWSGDPGRDNALERAWISSSLKISPLEQVAFLQKLVNDRLPVSREAAAHARSIVERTQAGDWVIQGKTGSAYPRNRDGSLDRSRGWGWYVGWARRGDTTLVFARLDQDERREKTSGGLRARTAFLTGWPDLASRFAR